MPFDLNDYQHVIIDDKDGEPPLETVKTNKNNLPAAFRRLVWNRYIGERWGTAKCWCCRQQTISVFNFEVGHVISRAKGGGDIVDNCRCICSSCNKSMSTMNAHDFRKKHGLEPTKLEQAWNWVIGVTSW